MNKYESVIILSQTIDEKGIKKIKENISNLINMNGKLENIENLGIKKLAYEIKNNKEGYYIIFYFESEPDFIRELERVYRITDEIIKFIVIRVD